VVDDVHVRPQVGEPRLWDVEQADADARPARAGRGRPAARRDDGGQREGRDQRDGGQPAHGGGQATEWVTVPL
jgi:hypothetical protein